MLNNKRKTLKKLVGFSAAASVLPGAWIKPIVSSVLLPVHAMTSSCTVRDIAGVWRFYLRNTEVSLLLQLNEDGTVKDSPEFPPDHYFWFFFPESNGFTLSEDGSDYRYSATINSRCNFLAGTWRQTRAGGVSGTWRATKE